MTKPQHYYIYLAAKSSLTKDVTEWAASSYPAGASWSVSFHGKVDGVDDLEALSEAVHAALDDLEMGVGVTIHTASQEFHDFLVNYSYKLPQKARVELMDRPGYNALLVDRTNKRYAETLASVGADPKEG